MDITTNTSQMHHIFNKKYFEIIVVTLNIDQSYQKTKKQNKKPQK